MKAKKRTRKNNSKKEGLINHVRIEFEISSKTLDSLLAIIEKENRSLDDIIKEGLEKFVNRFNKPIDAHKK